MRLFGLFYPKGTCGSDREHYPVKLFRVILCLTGHKGPHIPTGCRIPVVRLLREQDDRVQFSAPRPETKFHMERITLTTKPSKNYELIDSGMEEKLERYGQVELVRPDPQALWSKTQPETRWDDVHATFSREGREGQWKRIKDIPDAWPIEIGGLTMQIKPTSFKHTGDFPEQAPNWEWIRKTVALKPGASVLNLFGYTGGATIAAAQGGAAVTHVAASKTAVSWAKENADLSGVAELPIRWFIGDAITF